MKADGVDIFDYVLTEPGVSSNAPLDLYLDEIAVSAGVSVDEFLALRRWKQITIAARWLTRRQLNLVTQDMTHARLRADRPPTPGGPPGFR